MKTEAKSASILIATLAIGVVLGMVGQGLLLRMRPQPPDDRPSRGFAAHMARVIQLRPEQQQAVGAILDSVAHSNQQLIDGARGQLHTALDAMRDRLEPMLDAAQNERLAQMSRLPDPFRPPPRDGGRRMGPPGRGPRTGGPPPGPPPM